MERESQLRIKLLVMLGILGVSCSSIFIRFTGAPSMVVVFFRMAFAAVPLAVLVLSRKELRTELLGLGAHPVLGALLSGVFLALHLTAYVESVHLTTIASSTLLVDTEVLFVALVSVLLFRERISRAGQLGILLALAGSVMLSAGDFLAGAAAAAGTAAAGTAAAAAGVPAAAVPPDPLRGDLLALLGAMFLAVYTLLGSRLRRSMSTTVYTFLAYAGASAVLGLACFLTSVPLTGWGRNDYFFSFMMTLFCTFLGHSVFNWGLKYLPAPFVSTCRLGEPVFATILAALIFGEIPGVLQVIGGVIVLAGLYTYCMRE